MHAVLLALAVPVLVTVLGIVVFPGTASPTAAGGNPTIPVCPPDCGRVAAGDPLLVPYVEVNPGPGWLALPDSTVRPYVAALRSNLSRSAPTARFNVAAARWQWAAHGFLMQTVLVSSESLRDLHLANVAVNAQNLCSAAHGVGAGALTPIYRIPDSISGLCELQSRAGGSATVVAFGKANVAVLMEFVSSGRQPIDPRTAYLAVKQQYLTLPPAGVLVSNGGDPLLWAGWSVLIALILTCIAVAWRRSGLTSLMAIVTAAARRRRLGLIAGVLAVVGAMAFSMLDSSVLHGSGQWYEASYNDFWRNWIDAAQMTFGGGYGHIYRLDNTLETAPAFQLLISPIARLGFNLPFPDPSAVLYPEAFWLAGPVFLSSLFLPLCAGDRWLDLLGVAEMRRRVVVLGTMAITLPPAALGGHPEDLIALGALLYGLAAATQGRARAAGCWIGVAVAFQFFAVLAIPFAFLLLGRRRLLGTLVPMILIPAAVLAVPLVVDPSATLHALLHQRVYDDMGFITPTWKLDPGTGSVVRALVVVASIPAAVLLARRRRHDPVDEFSVDDFSLVIWTVAALFACRVFEPELVPYFLAPSLALFAIAAARARWWRTVACCALAVWLNWWVHVAIQARWGLWSLLILQLGLLGWLSRGSLDEGDRAPRRAPVVPGRGSAPRRPAARRVPA